jgi:hypothetical protein
VHWIAWVFFGALLVDVATFVWILCVLMPRLEREADEDMEQVMRFLRGMGGEKQ